MNVNKGGGAQSRGGMGGSGRGRGGPMSSNRGGMPARGRGGGGGSGGGGRGGQSGGVRAHGSRGNFGGGHGRRGGSFQGNHNHQGSFRNRQGGGRGGRHDGGSTASFNTKDGAVSSFGNVGKKDENRRTLTDFKIIGLEMPDLSWSWGILPSSLPIKAEVKEEATATDVDVKDEHAEANANAVKTEDTLVEGVSQVTEPQTLVGSNNGSMDTLSASEIKPSLDRGTGRASDSNLSTPPPSRMRIYFHTPVTADDSRPVPQSSSFTLGSTPADSRKGKRKKLEDDDADLEEDARVPRPPPQMATGDDRSSIGASAAPSVAETTSEADWLMAAIEGEEEAETEIELHPGDEEEGEQLHVSQLVGAQSADGASDDASTRTLGERTLDGELHLLYFPTTSFSVDNRPLDRHQTKRLSCTHPANISFKGNVDVKMNDSLDPDHARRGGDVPAPMNEGYDDAPSANVVGDPGGDLKDDPSGAVTLNGIVEHEQSAGTRTSGQEAPSDSSVLPLDSSDPASVSLQSQGATTVSSASVSVFDVISVLHDVPHSKLSLNSDEHAANHFGSPDMQVIQNGSGVTKSLQAVSLEPTLLNVEEAQDSSQVEYDAVGASTQLSEEETMESEALHGSAESTQAEHLPEPPASPASNTLQTTSSASTQGDSPTAPQKSEIPSDRTPSANRLSISYAGGNRRLVIDAEVVHSFKLFRQEGRVEVTINVDRETEDSLRGILVCIFEVVISQIDSYIVSSKAFLKLPSRIILCNQYMTIRSLTRRYHPFSKLLFPLLLHFWFILTLLDRSRNPNGRKQATYTTG